MEQSHDMYFKHTFVMIVFWLFPISAIAVDYKVICNKIQELSSQGKLKDAYLLSEKYSDDSDIVALQYAKFLFLMSNEKKGRDVFSRLNESKELSILQKENMARFIIQFELSLKKRLKKAQLYVKNKQCSKANIYISNLMKYESTRKQASSLINTCVASSSNSLWSSISGKIAYKLGHDSNIGLDNERLKSTHDEMLNDNYKKLLISINNKVNSKDTLWTRLQYDYYSLNYLSNKLKNNNQESHKTSITLGGNINQTLSWYAPITAQRILLDENKYSQYVTTKFRIMSKSNHNRHHMEIGLQDKTYLRERDKAHSGLSTDIGYGYRYLKGKNRVYTRVNIKQFNGPEDKSKEYMRYSSDISYSRKFINSLTPYNLKSDISLSYKRTVTNYEAMNSYLYQTYSQPYDNKREDQQDKISVNMRLKNKKWQLNGSLHQVKRTSNLPIYQYTRNTIELGIQYRF
jgi:hypothetical protein